MNQYERKFSLHVVAIAVLGGINCLVAGLAVAFHWHAILDASLGITVMVLYLVIAALYWGSKALCPKVSRNRKEWGKAREG